MAKRHGRSPEKRAGEPKRSPRTLKIGDIQVTTIRPNRGVIMMGDRTHLGDHGDFGSLADGFDSNDHTDTRPGDFKDK